MAISALTRVQQATVLAWSKHAGSTLCRSTPRAPRPSCGRPRIGSDRCRCSPASRLSTASPTTRPTTSARLSSRPAVSEPPTVRDSTRRWGATCVPFSTSRRRPGGGCLRPSAPGAQPGPLGSQTGRCCLRPRRPSRWPASSSTLRWLGCDPVSFDESARPVVRKQSAENFAGTTFDQHRPTTSDQCLPTLDSQAIARSGHADLR